MAVKWDYVGVMEIIWRLRGHMGVKEVVYIYIYDLLNPHMTP